MKIEPGKFYRTRGGRKARIYAVESRGPFPMHGAVLIGDVWVIAEWDPEGYDLNAATMRVDDIVSEWRDPPRVFWVNVYAEISEGCWYSPAYESRAQAEENASPDRIECIRVVESPEEDEG